MAPWTRGFRKNLENILVTSSRSATRRENASTLLKHFTVRLLTNLGAGTWCRFISVIKSYISVKLCLSSLILDLLQWSNCKLKTMTMRTSPSMQAWNTHWEYKYLCLWRNAQDTMLEVPRRRHLLQIREPQSHFHLHGSPFSHVRWKPSSQWYLQQKKLHFLLCMSSDAVSHVLRLK